MLSSCPLIRSCALSAHHIKLIQCYICFLAVLRNNSDDDDDNDDVPEKEVSSASVNVGKIQGCWCEL